MKKRYIFYILFALSFQSFSQKYDLGKVTEAELQQKNHPTDTSAVAAVLFKKGDVNFSYNDQEGIFFVLTTVKAKIKIYKKEGYDLANQMIDYYVGANLKESVVFDNVVTYNLVNGKIEKVKLKKEGEFDVKVNKYWNAKKISFPNVKEGSIIEFQYSIRSKRIGALRDWYFQSNIPVDYSEYKVYTPEYFVYKSNQKGYIFPKTEIEKNIKFFTIKTKEENYTDAGVQKASVITNNKIDYTETKTTYIAQNLPAMKEEFYVNNIDNYTSSVSHELESVQYPNQPIKAFSTDWKSVTKTIYDDEDFGPQLIKSGYFEDDLKVVLAGLNQPEEKLAAIFNLVKSKVKWDGFNGYSCNDGVKKAYQVHTGNAAEINLMLTAMLRYAGLNANPVLVSTRSNGIALYATIAAYNYVITSVQIGDNTILLDATDQYSMPNILPLRDLNWFGRIIKSDGSSTEIDLMPKKPSREFVSLNATIDASGEVKGELKKQIADNNALTFRQKYLAVNKEAYLEDLEKQNNAIEISEYNRENETDLAKPVTETYLFKDSKDVELIGSKMYVSPLLFLTKHENPFKQEVREFPIDFGFPSDTKYNITIKIPDGYAVESFPATINIASADNFCGYKYNLVANGNTIQVAAISTINVPIISPEYYETIKEFYKIMIEKQNEKIVLKKI